MPRSAWLCRRCNCCGGQLAIDVRFQLCNDKFCLPPKTVRVSFAGSEDVRKSVGGQQSAVSESDENRIAADDRQPPIADRSLGIYLAGCDAWGNFAFDAVRVPDDPDHGLVFHEPFVGSRSKAVRLAIVYSIGIIATFTLLGMLLAIFVGAAGINLFAANPWINLLITAIFLFFAFNLFGAYEITIPTGVLTKLDSLTRSHEGEGSGVIGALLMGLTFTLTSFTCTSPFVGTILVSASQGDWQMPLLGMLAFSTVFAMPFFVLAFVPQMGFATAAGGRLDEFGQGRNGISRSRGGDEVYFERRPGLEMGHFYPRMS